VNRKIWGKIKDVRVQRGTELVPITYGKNEIQNQTIGI